MSLCIFTDEFHVIALSVNGHIACHGECLKQVYFLVADNEAAGVGHFSHDGNFIVGHAYIDDGHFRDVGFQFLSDEVLGFAFGQSADVQDAQYGEVDIAFVVYQILLQYGLVCQVLVLITEGSGYDQVEWCCCFRIRSIDCDGQQVLGHDAGIIEGGILAGSVQILGCLQVWNLFVGGTACQYEGKKNQQGIIRFFHLSIRFFIFCLLVNKLVCLCEAHLPRFYR